MISVAPRLTKNGYVVDRHLQVPLELANVVLVQEVFLHHKAAVLVIQLGQKIMKPHRGQRLVLHVCDMVPLGNEEEYEYIRQYITTIFLTQLLFFINIIALIGEIYTYIV